jgi:putative transposase
MLRFKSLELASRTITGIEIVRMIKKDKVTLPIATIYKTFYSLAAKAK